MAYKVTKGGIGYIFVSVATLFGSLGIFLSIAELEVWMVCAHGLRKKSQHLFGYPIPLQAKIEPTAHHTMEIPITLYLASVPCHCYTLQQTHDEDE